MRSIAFSIVLLSLTFNAYSQQLSGLPFYKYYSTQEYDGGIQNWAITQNADGLLYVANNFGLLEYDGTKWNRYVLPSETKMRDVLIGDDGKIYVASQGDFGFYHSNKKGQFVFNSLADSLPDRYRGFDETWKVFKKKYDVFFCTFRQIFKFKDGMLTGVIEPSSAPENFHFVNHQLFVNQLDVGLSYLDGDWLKLFDQGDFFKNKAITGIIPLANNHLLIATNASGIYTYNGSTYRPWNPTNQDLFANSSINTAIRLRNGNIAIGSQNNGLFITSANGEILYHLNKRRGLNNRTVLSMYEDLLGNLWLGHNNGISSVELNVPFTMISEQIGLPGTGYDAHLFENRMYLGTNNGLYTKGLAESNYTFVKNTEGQVYTIQQIGNLKLLGHHKGTYTINGTNTKQVSDILGAWTFLPLKGNPNYIIGGTYKGLLLFEKKNGGLNFLRKINGFEESSRVMQQDAEGHIWMTHGYKGVYRLTLNDKLDSVSVKFYGKNEGLPSNILINVWRINDRLVYTTENQIYRYNADKDRFELDEFFTAFFPEGSQISYLEEDVMGNIYFLSTEEMGILEKLPNGGYSKKTKIFNRLRGLLNDDLQDLTVLNTKHVTYGAKEGFILYTKSNDSPIGTNFKTLIRNVSTTGVSDSVIYGGNYLDKQTPGLAYDKNSINIEYSAPFFHGNDKTVYSYKLEKSDKQWSEWTTKTNKEYTNLREGKYTFKVRAKNIYDEISQEATFRFEIFPPWFRTKTAYTIYTFSVLSLLFITFYWLDKRHRKERKRLELNQKRVINRMDSELRSSEEEVQRLKTEKLKAEVESKNQELATSTMHLLNKNSFINSMKHNISTIIKRSKNQEVQKELSKIMVNIEKNIAEDDDWEHFAIHFDQVHGDFTKRIQTDFKDLTPQEMKLSAYLRMNLSTKEIAHLLNISVRGVEIARYRLRKKLNLERSENLQEFILKY